jgi:hypothetical protein
MYFRTSSSSESFPCRTRSTTDIAVNCFDVDPMSRTDCGESATPSSRFAIP